MDPSVARNIAPYSQVDDRDRFGEPAVEHVERVAASVPQEASAVALWARRNIRIAQERRDGLVQAA
jgi:hypothetical protein